MTLPLSRLLAPLSLFLLSLIVLILPSSAASADEGWVIRSFASSFVINKDASVDVVEDIEVDFMGLEKHGIIRDIPVEYQIEGDPRHHRLIRLDNITVDNGNGKSHKFSRSRVGDSLQLKIGDPDRTISGPQRYRISYTVTGAFNSFDNHDEFFWNSTGDGWDVPMLASSATLTAPALQEVLCFQGYRNSKATCDYSRDGSSARFVTKGALQSFQGLTIVASVPKGEVDVPPPILKYIKTPEEVFVDFMGLKPLPIIGALILGIGGIGAVVRNWWLSGRDRWAGDVHYLSGSDANKPKPLFARETVVVEYAPPEIGKLDKRQLRPAEIGLLLDERADTLDISATIVDLAVRDYLRIEMIEGEGLFGKDDYKLVRLKESDDALLDYERRLHDELFDGEESVLMSSLKNKFYSDLATVKGMLYTQGTSKNKFFSRNPESVRGGYLAGGLVLAGLGIAAFVGLGIIQIGAILALPIIVAGLLMGAFASAMPRRTAGGREMYRRSLGFREYMEVAETDRQRFYEDVSIFDKYLPYAIVYGCTEKWAKAFEDIEGFDSTSRGWYVSNHAFTPVLFASTMNSFSSTVSSSISSTPASSGGSSW
jgi:hypothetical protein